MTTRLRGAAPWVGAAILTGALAPLLPERVLLVLAAALGLWLATVLISFYAGPERVWHPTLMLLTGLAMLSVTWNGVPLASTNVTDVLLLAAVGVLFACWLQGSVQVPIPGWLVAAAAALVAGQLVAQLFVPDPPADPPPAYTEGSALVNLAKVEMGMLVVPILFGAVASSWRRAELFVNIWLLSATVSAAVATVDAVAGTGIGPNIASAQVTEAERTAGLSLHPNHLALASAMALPLALRRVVQPGSWERAAAVAVAGMLLAGILVSGSRIGLLAAVMAVGITALLIVRLRARVVAAVLAAGVALLSIASFVPQVSSLLVGFDRLSGGGSAPLANSARFDQFEESLAIALDHPVTGVGFTTITDAHNLLVQFWEAAGILGVFAFVLFVAGAFGTGWRLHQDRGLPTGVPELAGALTASFAVWVLAGLFQSHLGDRYIYVPVGLLIGLQLAARNSGDARGRSVPAPALPATSSIPDSVGAKRVPVARYGAG